MGSLSDKASGVANEAIGNIKQGIGKAAGSDKMQAEGILQENKGHAQKAVGDAKAAAKNMADSVSDVANRNL